MKKLITSTYELDPIDNLFLVPYVTTKTFLCSYYTPSLLLKVKILMDVMSIYSLNNNSA